MKFPLSNFADCSRACCFLSNTSRLLNQNSTALKVQGMEDKECNWMSTLLCKDLEVTAIRTLKDLGLEGIRRPPYTGIWIGDKKIAAIGVAVRRSITFHGLALNVNTDLSYFNRIIPCGLSWADVTSMARELGKEQSAERVKDRFLDHFAELFGYSDVERYEDGESRMEDRNPQSSIIHPRPA